MAFLTVKLHVYFAECSRVECVMYLHPIVSFLCYCSVSYADCSFNHHKPVISNCICWLWDVSLSCWFPNCVFVIYNLLIVVFSHHKSVISNSWLLPSNVCMSIWWLYLSSHRAEGASMTASHLEVVSPRSKRNLEDEDQSEQILKRSK